MPGEADATPTRPIRKLLVANRSEIAIRVFRSAHELGIRTVAIYSHEDRFALHRFKADEAYRVGKPGEPIRSLPGHRRRSSRWPSEHGVDAIHPGYGFLSENADFARACARGRDHVRRPARRAARAARRQGRRPAASPSRPSVPVLSGSDEPVDDQRRGARSSPRSSAIPVIVKAAMGGGGRGMRVVERPSSSTTPSTRPARGRHRLRRRRRLPRKVRPPRQATSRCSSSATSTATSSTCSSATARSSAGTRRSSRSPRRRTSTRRVRAGASATPPSPSAGPSGYDNAGTVEFLVDADTRQVLLHRGQPAHPGRAHRHRGWSPASTSSRAQILDRPGAAAGRPRDRPGRPGRDQHARLRHPVPGDDRRPGQQLHARLRPDHALPLGRRPGHPPRRAARRSPARSSRRSTTRCW